jgi:HEAT repeat protein
LLPPRGVPRSPLVYHGFGPTRGADQSEGPSLSSYAGNGGLRQTVASQENEADTIAQLLRLRPIASATAKPSERFFRELARTAPDQLRGHIHNATYSAGLRARATEAAGDMLDGDAARGLLLPLLKASEAIIQEAAVYALERHMNDKVCASLRELIDSDETADGVREAAEEALDELDE